MIGIIYLVIYGIDNALLVSTIVILSSHNIDDSICCYNVDSFIPTIVILKYDCKLALNIVVKNLSIVGIRYP